MKFFLCASFAILLCFSDCMSQTIIKGNVTDTLGHPVVSASIYLSKTTIGTLTDNNGAFTLKIPENGIYELIASFVGFRSASQFVAANGENQTIDITLHVNAILLSDIIVTASEKDFVNNYTLFKRLFLGETSNSQYCRILNPRDLHLRKNEEDNTLTGFSVKTLRIENRSLGYLIKYDLFDFTYDYGTGFLNFRGNYYLDPLEGNKRDVKRWNRNRLSAYYGSRMHFFRSFFSDSLYSQNYKLFEVNNDSVKNEISADKVLSREEICAAKGKSFLTLYYQKPVLVTYVDNHAELSTRLTGFTPGKMISTIRFSDFINIYKNGFFDNPYAITWKGSMASDRIADMLPYDFLLREDENEETEILPAAGAIIDFKNRYPDDQVFVHTDRNLYAPGDTVWFQAYLKNRYTHIFESESKALYVLLFNEDHRLADSSRFRINDYSSTGWMKIPSASESGRYRLVAFTSLMQNYDPSNAFQLDLHVIKTAAVQQKKDTTGSSNITSLYELRFLPEGGSMVKGLKQCIGFNATDNLGQPVYITGLLKDSSGLTIDTIRSGKYGPGSFTCTGEPGLYVELDSNSNYEKIWPLPGINDKGLILHVTVPDKESLGIIIESNYESEKKVHLAVIMNVTNVYSEDIILKNSYSGSVNTAELMPGVATITVFDDNYNVLAERQVYVNSHKHIRINIQASNTIFKPGDETELHVNLTDDEGKPVKGFFSMAVIDSASGYDPGLLKPSIFYSFDYQPYFISNLPRKVLSSGIENLSDEDRDLLLMVYGWSRYAWNPVNKKIEDDLADYDVLKMKILYTTARNRFGRNLDLVSLEGPLIKHLKTNRSGEITLMLDSLADFTRSVTMMPDVKNKKIVRGAMLSIPYNEKYFKSDKFLNPLEHFSQYAISAAQTSIPEQQLGKIIAMPEVVIEGKAVIKNKYEERYQYANVKSLDFNSLWTSLSIREALFRVTVPYRITDDYVVLRPPTSIFGGGLPALIVLDGMALYSGGWRIAQSFNPSELTSLTVLIGTRGTTMYGSAAQGGIIFLETRSTDPSFIQFRTDWRLQHAKDKMLLPISLFRPEKQIYVPTGIQMETDPLFQYSSTTFWDPELYFDGVNPVTIKYYNSKRQGKVLIHANGVSVDNLAGSGSATYSIR